LKALIEFTDHAYTRLIESLEDVTDLELHWKPVPEMNTAEKILRHSARISVILLPQVVEGKTTGSWYDDYEKKDHSLDEMLGDIKSGRKKVLEHLDLFVKTDLETIIPLWGSHHRRAEGIYMLVGELLYHAGQIALLRGAFRRANSG
jgi:hypothetical protein